LLVIGNSFASLMYQNLECIIRCSFSLLHHEYTTTTANIARRDHLHSSRREIPADFEVVAAGAEPVLVVAGVEPVPVGLERSLMELPSDFVITKISPVESLLMKRRPLLSQASETGLKQPVGHFELS